jgi:hypothetical protein
VADILTYNSLMAKNKALADEIATLNAQASAGGGGSRTWDPKNWGNLTLLPFCGLKGSRIIQNDSNAGCGATCTWTVPAGATKVQFQVWGAGANGGAGECCGMGFSGGNAAYATVTIDAVAGCQYAITAGCSLCCCMHYGAISGNYTPKCYTPDNQLKACPSFVTGFGLTNFCAEGGMHLDACRYKETLLIDRHGSNWQSITTAKTCGTGNPMCNNFIGESLLNHEGWCMANGAPHLCLSCGAKVMNGCHPVVEECCTRFFGTTQGILGSYAGWQWYESSDNAAGSCQLQGRICRGPVHATCTLTPTWPGPHWFNFNGGFAARDMQVSGCTTLCCYEMPGMGGLPGFGNGGSCGGGFRGTGGAVRVSWC